jgi:hypothetical protein
MPYHDVLAQKRERAEATAVQKQMGEHVPPSVCDVLHSAPRTRRPSLSLVECAVASRPLVRDALDKINPNLKLF